MQATRSDHRAPRPSSGPWRAGLAAYGAMPRTLQGLVGFFVPFGAASVLVALWPAADFDVAGRPVAWRDFWAAGQGPVALGIGLHLGLAGVGCLVRARWAPWLVIAAYGWLIVATWVTPETGATSFPRHAALGGTWVVTTSAYLFGASGTRAWFARASPRPAPSDGAPST